ncbi:MAG: AEC family transporter [Bacteriovoracaceae bacterium]|nr:AEC family transporter [Bacteriovoracaceae bacterium]
MITEFFIILTFITIGMLLKRVKAFPDNTSYLLNQMVIWVALPAVILLQIPKIQFTTDTLISALAPWLIIFVFALLTLIFGKFVKLDTKTLGALLLLVPLGNTSFIGIPMVSTFFGENQIPYAIVYDQFGSFVGLATYGVLIVSIYASGEKLKIKNAIHKMITFPPFISLILAFIISYYLKAIASSYPSFVQKTLTTTATTLIPMAMIAVGFQFKLKLNNKGYIALSFGLFSKLILAPLLLFLLFKATDVSHQAAKISIFESAMPQMITAGAISISSGLDEDLTASLVGGGLLVSFITLPLVHFAIINWL